MQREYEVIYQLRDVGVQREVVSASSEWAARRVVEARYGDAARITEVRTVR